MQHILPATTNPQRLDATLFFVVVVCLLGWPVLGATVQAQTPEKTSDISILFIRGGEGTGGFLEGGSDDQLSSIGDYSTANRNHGWGWLADTLRAEGYTLEEIREEPVVDSVPTPIDFANMDLTPYAAIVLASNNAAYGTAAVDAIEEYIRNGGGVLFISDANFGQDWPDAPTSDQHFLDRFGLVMNQDRGTYSITDDEFVVPAHPILNGVGGFDGEGVSPITVGDSPPADVSITILARAEGTVRRNDTSSGRGSSTAATDQDAALVALEVGDGHVVGHFDRNTFFNQNGAGTDITRFDNARYAKNLFAWLTQGGALPVEWVRLEARTDGQTVHITWETASESNNAGFEIQQQTNGGVFRRIGYVEGEGSSTQSASYTYTVPNLEPGRYVFRLKQIDVDGFHQYSSELEVQVANEEGFQLGTPVPNPTSAGVYVALQLNRPQWVEVAVIDILGRYVGHIHRGYMQDHGEHMLRIPAELLSTGVYLVHARGDYAEATTTFVSVH